MAAVLRLLIVASALILLAACGSVESTTRAQSVSSDAIEVEGPMVLYIRHAMSDRSVEDSQTYNLSDPSTQRMLSPAGQEQSRELGEFLRQEGWEADIVIASPWARCIRTAELAFGLPLRVDHRLATFHRMSDETKSARMAWFRETLSASQYPDANRIILVGHSDFLKELGIEDVEEGEGVFFSSESGEEVVRLRRDPYRLETP